MYLQQTVTAVTNSIRALLNRQKTVDGIVASITTQITELQQLAQRRRDDAARDYAKATALDDAADEAIDDAADAARIAGNLQRLVG